MAIKSNSAEACEIMPPCAEVPVIFTVVCNRLCLKFCEAKISLPQVMRMSFLNLVLLVNVD